MRLLVMAHLEHVAAMGHLGHVEHVERVRRAENPADDGARSGRVAADSAAEAGSSVGDAVSTFLANESLPAGYVEMRVGGHRALCASLPTEVPASGEPAASAPSAVTPVLLATEEGAAYLFDRLTPDVTTSAAAALRANRYRQAGGTLALRLPAECGGGTGTFSLWAAPKYLAGADQGDQVWK